MALWGASSMTARQRYATSITAFVLIGAIAGIGTSFLLPRTYVSTANLFIEPKRGSASDWINEALRYVFSRGSLRGIIESEGLYQRELERLPMEDLIEKMRHDIQVEKIGQVGSVQEIRVSFRHEDGAAAELTTRALMDSMISPRTAVEVLAVDPSWQPLSLEVADPPRPVQTAGRGIGRIGSALRRVAFAGIHEQITYAGVLRVRGAKSASDGAPDASELRAMVLEALKQQAYLEPEGESIDATIAKMRLRLRFETGRLGDELNIFYSDASPARAQGTLANVVARVLESHMDPSGPVVEVFGPPSRPESYEELPPYTMAAAGACVGLLLGLTGLRFFSKRYQPA
jgi:hypothetical protein